MILCILTFIGLAIWIGYKFMKSKEITRNTLRGYTGGLGAGKSYMGVTDAIRTYRKSCFFFYVNCVLHPLKLVKREYKGQKPQLYSNIPIRIRGNKWSRVLKAEHLLQRERCPVGSVWFIDEIGSIASQYSYNEDIVNYDFCDTIRFARHYFGRAHGAIIFTDQSISNCSNVIKRRVNSVYNLDNFKRFMGILPFYTVRVQELLLSEENLQNTNDLDGESNEYFFGFLPYKFMKFSRHYDTYCYSENYMKWDLGAAPDVWNGWKANYVINLFDYKPQMRKLKIKK